MTIASNSLTEIEHIGQRHYPQKASAIMTAAEWVALARAVDAPVHVGRINGKRYLYAPEGWDGLPELPLKLLSEAIDILEAELSAPKEPMP